MTSKEFAAALTDRLRRKGVSFESGAVEAFATAHHLHMTDASDLHAWADRFLAAEAIRPPLIRKRRLGLILWGMMLVGASVLLSLCVWYTNPLTPFGLGFGYGLALWTGAFGLFLFVTELAAWALLRIAPAPHTEDVSSRAGTVARDWTLPRARARGCALVLGLGLGFYMLIVFFNLFNISRLHPGDCVWVGECILAISCIPAILIFFAFRWR